MSEANTHSQHLKLKLPQPKDQVSRQDFVDNWNKIDDGFGRVPIQLYSGTVSLKQQVHIPLDITSSDDLKHVQIQLLKYISNIQSDRYEIYTNYDIKDFTQDPNYNSWILTVNPETNREIGYFNIIKFA
ncbi:hypothetical protein [Longirhabdus pacifica]|uniref:hypothetical protein n=1 Tax=Longirhabdus pacifica TaxID=2305227 RepID=UPI001008DED5|nr:hypothetical protein [Longirhabdus pacifica]